MYSGYAPTVAAMALGLGLIYNFSPAIAATIPPSVTPGKVMLSAVALITSTGCYLADWSETHVLNPRWPPHAKFQQVDLKTYTVSCLLRFSALPCFSPALDMSLADCGP